MTPEWRAEIRGRLLDLGGASVGASQDFPSIPDPFFDLLCWCCFRQIKRASAGEVDHYMPLSRGGQDRDANLILLHAQCNKEKYNRTLWEHWEWRVQRGLDEENLGRKNGVID